MERELCLQVPKSKSKVQTTPHQNPFSFLSFFFLSKEMYCLTVLETTRPKLRFLKQLAPFGRSEGKHVPCSSLSFCWLPVILGVLWFISVSFFTLSLHLYLWVSAITLIPTRAGGRLWLAAGTGAPSAVPEGALGTNPPGGRH